MLLYEATGTLQTEKEDYPGLSGWPHLITGALTAEGAAGGQQDVTLKKNQLTENRKGMWVASEGRAQPLEESQQRNGGVSPTAARN